MREGVSIRSFMTIEAIAKGTARLACVFTGRTEAIEADAVVLVTARLPNEQLFLDLTARAAQWADAGLEQVTAVGDALAPATIAHATYAGRRFAEELDAAPLAGGAPPFKRGITELVALD